MAIHLEEIRHHLHSYPELSGSEQQTATFIKQQLVAIGISETYENVGGNSLVAVIRCLDGGSSVLFRSELDALPITEASGAPYSSKVLGKAHSCGHDGHSTILLGLAERLYLSRTTLRGRYYLLFQEAEEIGQGASKFVESGFLSKHHIDYAFALHNIPKVKKKSILCKDGVFTPTVESLIIRLQGRTSHAGEPHKGLSPATTIAQIISFFSDFSPADASLFVVAPVYIRMGEKAFGIAAGDAEIGYTMRSTNPELFQRQKSHIEEKVSLLAHNSSLSVEFSWTESFYSNVNDPQSVDFIRDAAERCSLAYINKAEPFSWGEDFGIITQYCRGAMFGLGAGNDTFPLHDSRYDFPDDIISDGIAMFFEIAQRINGTYDLQQ